MCHIYACIDPPGTTPTDWHMFHTWTVWVLVCIQIGRPPRRCRPPVGSSTVDLLRSLARAVSPLISWDPLGPFIAPVTLQTNMVPLAPYGTLGRTRFPLTRGQRLHVSHGGPGSEPVDGGDHLGTPEPLRPTPCGRPRLARGTGRPGLAWAPRRNHRR